MFDHVTIRVGDRAASERFYETTLAVLGIDPSYSTRTHAIWQDYALTESDGEHPVTRGLRVAFAAPSREQVDDFWQTGVGAGYEAVGAPGTVQGGAYGAILRDPSGNAVAAVDHGSTRGRDGRIDHLVLRVADLGAATAFYRRVAAAAAFDLREEGPERSVFSARAPGGSFTLLLGSPATEGLHVAFPGDDDAVRRFHADALAAGAPDNGAPGERPQYHPGYYAAYVLDPGGNNIEVVDHHRP